jgi:hypothetical protein
VGCEPVYKGPWAGPLNNSALRRASLTYKGTLRDFFQLSFGRRQYSVLIGLHALSVVYLQGRDNWRHRRHALGIPVQVRASNPARAERNRILTGAGPKPPAAAHENDAHGTAWCAGRRGYCASALLVAFRVGGGCGGGAVKPGTKSLVKQGHSGRVYWTE